MYFSRLDEDRIETDNVTISITKGPAITAAQVLKDFSNSADFEAKIINDKIRIISKNGKSFTVNTW